MKLVYIITGLGIGGAETILVDMVNRLCKRGFRIYVLYLTGKNKFKEKIDKNVHVIDIGIKNNFFDFVRGIFKAAKIIRKIKPDVVHSHMIHANIFARILRIFVMIPKLICTAHSIYEGGKIRSFMYRITDFLSDVNTNVSYKALKVYVDNKLFSKGKSICVYNGIDIDKFKFDENTRIKLRKELSIKDEDFVFINAGRLTEAKNQIKLLDSFHELSKDRSNIKLLILGEGHLRRSLEDKIKYFGLSDKCFLLGSKQNIEDYYFASDCLVSFSLWEGFSLVILESIVSGLPVIATNAGGIEELIDEKFIASVDNIDILKEKMIYIMDKKYDWYELFEQYREFFIKEFDINKIVSTWIYIYYKK